MGLKKRKQYLNDTIYLLGREIVPNVLMSCLRTAVSTWGHPDHNFMTVRFKRRFAGIPNSQLGAYAAILQKPIKTPTGTRY